MHVYDVDKQEQDGKEPQVPDQGVVLAGRHKHLIRDRVTNRICSIIQNHMLLEIIARTVQTHEIIYV